MPGVHLPSIAMPDRLDVQADAKPILAARQRRPPPALKIPAQQQPDPNNKQLIQLGQPQQTIPAHSLQPAFSLLASGQHRRKVGLLAVLDGPLSGQGEGRGKLLWVQFGGGWRWRRGRGYCV
jgi:hypothetical protein